MAAYGSGDYSGGRYSFGAYLGALAVVAASTVVVAGDKIKDAQFEIFSTSSVSVDATKISSSSIAISSNSEMTVAGGLDAVGSVAIVSVSNLVIEYNRILSFEMIMVDNSSVVINARKKWETESDISESWTTVSV
jgi:hypothetical protein